MHFFHDGKIDIRKSNTILGLLKHYKPDQAVAEGNSMVKVVPSSGFDDLTYIFPLW